MAITIDSEPSGSKFAYRPLLHEITSDSTAIVRTIADVYVDSVYVASLEGSPELTTTDEFVYDIQGVVQDNLDNVSILLTEGIVTTKANYKEVYVKFYEVNQNADGTLTTTWAEDGAGTGSVNSTVFSTINGTLGVTETNTNSAYQVGGSYGRLSKMPNKTRVKKGDIIPLTVINATGLDVRTELIQYEADGTQISSTNLSSVVSTYHMIYSRYDTSNVASNCAYLTLQIENTSSVALSDAFRFDLVTANDDQVTINWFNSVGGIDYHLFEGKKTKKVRSKTNVYKQASSGNFDASNRGNTMYSVEGSETFECYTSAQTEERLRHLQELITHKTDVYVIENGVKIPIIITSATEKVNDSDDSVMIFKITFQYSNNTISQRG
jgi:hypothetical protein